MKPAPCNALARAGSGAPSYRQDIEGLRAVAILLVVVYHVWIGRVSGGVDVFLMISAFFLTGSFLRRMRAGAPLAVGGFLLGRFRRLMPASSVVLAATLLATFLIPMFYMLVESAADKLGNRKKAKPDDGKVHEA